MMGTIDSITAHLVQEYQEHKVVPEASEPVEGWHLNTKPADA